jgi:hypothetical protein
MSNTSIIITRTRNDTNVGWLNSNTTDPTNFTTEEYENIVLPYWQWVESLPGFQSITINFPDDFTKETIYTFDTSILDTANVAWSIMNTRRGEGNENQHPLANSMSSLLRTKVTERTPEQVNTYGTVSFLTTD